MFWLFWQLVGILVAVLVIAVVLAGIGGFFKLVIYVYGRAKRMPPWLQISAIIFIAWGLVFTANALGLR